MENNKPNYIKGIPTLWFDSRKIHGTETNGYGVSLRVDGEFTSEFRDKLNLVKVTKWMTLKEKDYDNYRKVSLDNEKKEGYKKQRSIRPYNTHYTKTNQLLLLGFSK